MTDDFIFRKSIPVRRTDKTIDVRGLSLDDISALLQANLGMIVKAVEHYRDSMSAVYSRRSMDDFLLTLATSFPVLAAEIIAHAADHPYDADVYRKLPGGISLACLLAIAELTLEDMGSLADPSPALASLVSSALAGARPKTTSPDSTGA